MGLGQSREREGQPGAGVRKRCEGRGHFSQSLLSPER